MKILLCTPFSGTVGGISLWANRLFAYYKSKKHSDIELEIFSLSRTKSIHANTPFSRRLFWGIYDYLAFIFKFTNKLFQKDINIVHLVSSGSFGLIKDIIFLLLSKIFLKKSILHFRFGRIPIILKNKNWEYYLLKISIYLSKTVIVIDSNSYNSLKENGMLNVIYIPNPLDDSVVEFVSKNQIERKINSILFAGHLVPTKGIFELVEATKEMETINILFAGFYNEDIAEKIKELTNNSSRYILLGEKPYEETLKEMLKCGIFILPSYTEGFPNVILESMACGCPIISTKVGAIPDMLSSFENRSTGVCIEPKNANQLRIEILNIYQNYDEALKMGHNASKKVVNDYSMDKIWNELKNLWCNI